MDLDPKFRLTLCCDVMQLDERSLGSFDMVWASPVCTEYSRALSRRPRDLAAGDRLVLRALEIPLLGHGKPADGPSQDAGVHAGAALQRRVLLQIWIQVQKGHKDLAQPALGALTQHAPQGGPLRRLRGWHPPRGRPARHHQRPPQPAVPAKLGRASSCPGAWTAE